MRGILAHQYEVPVEEIIWVVSSEEPLFRGLSYPHSSRFHIEKVAVTDDGSHGFLPLLESGAVDAMFLAAGGIDATGASRKLFEDPYPEIERYVAETGVFPINTLITLKESVVKALPGLPGALMEAWERARALYAREMEEGKETDHMGIEVGRLKAMKVFPRAYGIEANRMAIRMMIQYCYEQGLIRTLFEPEELFFR
jgi:4,5-dihydroxyphthalate decarboxylase